MITPGTSVRFEDLVRRARLRTSRSWRASSSMLSAGARSIRTMASRKAIAIALRKLGADPSTSLIDTEMIAALSTREPSPKVRTVIGRRIRIRTGQRTALSTATRPVISRTARKLGTLIPGNTAATRSEEHTSELQSRRDLVCRLLLEKKNKKDHKMYNTA